VRVCVCVCECVIEKEMEEEPVALLASGVDGVCACVFVCLSV